MNLVNFSPLIRDNPIIVVCPVTTKHTHSQTISRLRYLQYSQEGDELLIQLEMLRFKDVCVDIGDRRILRGVSGAAEPWEVLAVMGPSGEFENKE